MAGLARPPCFCGVRLAAPDATTAWVVVRQIANGEYRWPGFTPEPGWRVVDVGANIGAFSLWAHHLGAVVTAIEPEPETFGALAANSRDRFGLVHAAVVGNAKPTARLYLSPIRSTRHSLLARKVTSGERLPEFVDVPALTLAAVVGPGCDLLKLDCEGAEFETILAADDDVLRRAQRVIIEFHRVAGEPELLLDRLREAGMEASVLSDEGSLGMIGARSL